MTRSQCATLVILFSPVCLGCEGGDLALSAGAPAVGAVAGSISRCGVAVEGAAVSLQVHQDQLGQARPVDTRVGPVATDSRGEYLLEFAPHFAVPGPATVQLRVRPAGDSVVELPGGTVLLGLAQQPLDTLRLDGDLGAATGVCAAAGERESNP